MHHATLSHASLKQLRQLFQQLSPPPLSIRTGFYQASFIGPAWLRACAEPSVALCGLPGWQGKRFLDPLTATNVLRRRGQLVEKFSMQCNRRPSLIDGQNGVDLSYGACGPIPWRWLRDELRQLDDNTLLGMTIIALPILKHLAFPFLLRRTDAPDL